MSGQHGMTVPREYRLEITVIPSHPVGVNPPTQPLLSVSAGTVPELTKRLLEALETEVSDVRSMIRIPAHSHATDEKEHL